MKRLHHTPRQAPAANRPRVLTAMPHSANVVFDVLRSLASPRRPTELSIRDLAETCRLSDRQTRRALARLVAVRLLGWDRGSPGRGRRSSFTLLWRNNPSQRAAVARHGRGDVSTPGRSRREVEVGQSEGVPGYPQRKGAPYARETVYPGEVRLSHTDARRPSDPTAPIRGERAHRWAMARLREEVNRWPIPWERRATVLAGVGGALWRVIERREVRTREELAAVVRGVVRRLREASGISGDLRTACRYGRWAVKGALAEARAYGERDREQAVTRQGELAAEAQAEERWTALRGANGPAITVAIALRPQADVSTPSWFGSLEQRRQEMITALLGGRVYNSSRKGTAWIPWSSPAIGAEPPRGTPS